MPLPSRPSAASGHPGAPVRSRRAIRFGLAAAIALASVIASEQPANAQQVPSNPLLPRVALNAGIHRIQAEVADSPQKRQRGLMMREKLGPNEGMLFVFEDQAVHCFWMKNTPLPLSIAFLGDDGAIVNIADMSPLSEDTHCPSRPIRYALEMEQGWFAHKGIVAGNRISGLQRRPPGS